MRNYVIVTVIAFWVGAVWISEPAGAHLDTIISDVEVDGR